jgi:cytochrome P450
MDPESFSDPYSFNPDRFIDKNGKLFATDKIGSFSMGMYFYIPKNVIWTL